MVRDRELSGNDKPSSAAPAENFQTQNILEKLKVLDSRARRKGLDCHEVSGLTHDTLSLNPLLTPPMWPWRPAWSPPETANAAYRPVRRATAPLHIG